MIDGSLPGFDFSTAGTIRFGRGLASVSDSFSAVQRSRVFLLTGSDPGRHEATREAIASVATEVCMAQLEVEPDTSEIRRLVDHARSCGAGGVVAIGGGSVMDAGKVIAALLTNTDDLFSYLEIIGDGKPLAHEPVPYIAVPTTAGTGSEVTRNAVIGSREHGVKVSMRSRSMLPAVALVDPELCLSLPERPTVLSGLDAATQLIEAFTSRHAQPLTDALCRDGLEHFAWGFEPAVAHAKSDRGSALATEEDRRARGRMCVAALFSGLALANAKLGAVHGFAGPLGGMIHAPHGALCATLLPEVTRMNLAMVDENIRSRYARVTEILFGPDISVDELPAQLDAIRTAYRVPGLRELGLTPDRYEEASEKASRAGSMKGNPVTYSVDQLAGILERSA